MKTEIKKIIERVLHILPLFTIVAMLTITLVGCTGKDNSKTDSGEGSQEAILENEGELEILVPEGEETFGE